MATYNGKLGVVKSGANAVGEVTGFSVNTTATVTDDPSLGDDWRTIKSGTKAWSGTIDCNFDYGDTTGQNTLDEGQEVTLELYPVDEAAGNMKISGSAVITGVTYTNGGNDPIVSASFTFDGNGAMTREATI